MFERSEKSDPPPPPSFQTTFFHKSLRGRADACFETAGTWSFRHRLTAVRLQGKRSMGGGAGESVPGVRAAFCRLTDIHFTTNVSNSSLYRLMCHSSDKLTNLRTCSWDNSSYRMAHKYPPHHHHFYSSSPQYPLMCHFSDGSTNLRTSPWKSASALPLAFSVALG